MNLCIYTVKLIGVFTNYLKTAPQEGRGRNLMCIGYTFCQVTYGIFLPQICQVRCICNTATQLLTHLKPKYYRTTSTMYSIL